MARKLISAAVALAMALPGTAYPLGLGKISIRSVLNQPLRAEIEIFSADPKDLSSLTVRLAPASDFQKAGIDRPLLLSRLRFEMNRRSDGSSIIAIRSSEPIREPFLNFLVEVDWPAGRAVHEYAVLLDPPRLTTRPLSPPMVTISEPRLGQQVRRRPAPPPKKPEEPPDPDLQPTVQYGPVKPNETLWHIAQTLRPSPAVSSQRIMTALLRANPAAFLGGNPNALMSGVTLRTPSAEQLRALAQRIEARASKHGQTLPVREKSAKIGVGTSPPLTPTESPSSGPSLKIQNPPQSGQVSQSPGNGTTDAKGQDKVPSNLEQRLNQLEENSHVSRKENEELRVRLTESEKQIQGLERNLQVKNEQLAKLQGQFLPSATQPIPQSSPAQVAPTVLPVVLPTPTVPLVDPLIDPTSEVPPLLRPLVPETPSITKTADSRPIAAKTESSSNSEQSSILLDPIFIGLLGTLLTATGFLGRLFIRRRKNSSRESPFSPSNTVQQVNPPKAFSGSASTVTRRVLDPKKVAQDKLLKDFAGINTHYPTLSLELDTPPNRPSFPNAATIPSQRAQKLSVPNVAPTPLQTVLTQRANTVSSLRANVVLPETPTRGIPGALKTSADSTLAFLEDELVSEHASTPTPSWSARSSPVLEKPIPSPLQQDSDDIFKETTKAPVPIDPTARLGEEVSFDDELPFDLDFLDLPEDSSDLSIETDTNTPQKFFGTQSVPDPEVSLTPEALLLDEIYAPEEEEGEEEEMENLLQLAKTYLEDGDREGALETIQEVLDSGKPSYRKRAEALRALL